MRIVVGTALTALGILWILQGADLVHIRPVLCIADCEPVTGGSVTWLVVGIVSTAVGLWVFRGRSSSGASR